MWLVAAVLDSTGAERFHHHRKFCETALVEMEGQAPLEVLLHKPRDSPFCDLSHAADMSWTLTPESVCAVQTQCH